MTHSFYGHIYGTLPPGIDLSRLQTPGKRMVFFGCGCAKRLVDDEDVTSRYCSNCYASLADHAEKVRHELPLSYHRLTVYHVDKDPHYVFTADHVGRLTELAQVWPNTYAVSGTPASGFTMADTIDHRALRKSSEQAYHDIVRGGLVFDSRRGHNILNILNILIFFIRIIYLFLSGEIYTQADKKG
jgi:hypothetical protein